MYVRTGKFAGLGRLARAHRLSGFRRSRLGQQDDDLYPATAAENASPYYNPTTGAYTGPGSGSFTSIAPMSATSAGGGLTTSEAGLISSAINAVGAVGVQALKPTPSLTYNPATGQFTATGGATIPSSIGLNSTIESFLPYLLIGGVILVVVSMGKR